MEKKITATLTPEELSLLEFALVDFIHTCKENVRNLSFKDSPQSQRKDWEECDQKCHDLLRKLTSLK